MKSASKSARRTFDETFKREAGQHWLGSGQSGGKIAEELGILPNRLYAWRQRFAPAPAGAGAKRWRTAWGERKRLSTRQKVLRRLDYRMDCGVFLAVWNTV